MKAETKKKLFEILEKVDGSAELLELVKADLKVDDDTEAKARKLEKTVESFAGIDISQAKAVMEYVDKHGGIEGITKLAVKATEGEAEKSRVAEMQKQYDLSLAEHKANADKMQAYAKTVEMKNQLIPFFSENFLMGSDILDMALSKGIIAEGEKGLVFKSGDIVKSLADGGYEELKREFSQVLKTPAGGGIGGGTNGGNTGGAGKAANPFD